jgi:hypothetical protein
MKAKETTSAGPARAIIRFTNPCVLGVMVLMLMAFTGSSSMRILVVWATTILLSFLVVLPLVYIFMRTHTRESGKKLLADPTSFLRQHPRDILILGVLLALPCLIILTFLNASSLLLCTLASLLVSSLVAALINIFYRVSYHLTAVTILAIMVSVTWGRIILVLLVAIPLVGWAKYQLHEHTLAQMAIAIALSAMITAVTLHLLSV